VILGVIFASREFQIRRTADLHATELAADLSQARLKHLTAQIEPHFLFNALNAISNRMHEDVEAADRMIADLGGLMRAAYDSDNHVLVPLARELEWLRGYAAMMTERFRGQLSFELQVEPGLEAVRVPRLLLQPLVENALRHGLPAGRGNLWVDVAREGATLRYAISDDGEGIKDIVIKPGTGLSNVARRLELLFPGAHSFALAPRSPKGTVATLSFPVAP
jgi:two-component system, LytTR family, sensor kinase